MAGIPWYLWLSVLGVTSAMIGVHWDISWHRSIGRDTFWTPAHMAIQLCGVIAGITCGYLILATTKLREASVNVLGFRGPLGAFICAWGGFTMITSAPFDDWWHNAYGLDVKILSPPHVVLAIGMMAVAIGTMVLIAASRNRASGLTRQRLELLLLYVSGMVLVGLLVMVLESTERAWLHTAVCLSRNLDRHSRGPCNCCPDHGTAMGRHNSRRDLHSGGAGAALDSPALPGRTEARAGNARSEAVYSGRLPAAGRSAGHRSGPPVAAHRGVGPLAASDGPAPCSSLCCCFSNGRSPIFCNPRGHGTRSSAVFITTISRAPIATRQHTGSFPSKRRRSSASAWRSPWSAQWPPPGSA